jgi:hypothetical protein
MATRSKAAMAASNYGNKWRKGTLMRHLMLQQGAADFVSGKEEGRQYSE